MKNIILTGFMGAGKTTVGQILASKLNCPFIDIDEKIEQDYQLKTTAIFEHYGEKEFRKSELKQIQKYCANYDNQVISLGGGAFIQKEVKDICMNNGTVFFLSVPWSVWKQRLDSLIATRPILQGKTESEIQDLFKERQKIYDTHHYLIHSDTSPEHAAEEILGYLQQIHSN